MNARVWIACLTPFLTSFLIWAPRPLPFILLLLGHLLPATWATAEPVRAFVDNCSGEAHQDTGGNWQLVACNGEACTGPDPSCGIYTGQISGHVYCGCGPNREPGCCHVWVKDGVLGLGGSCPACQTSGECVYQVLPGSGNTTSMCDN